MRGGGDDLAEVKWIKISTNMFDNRKIKQIRKLPEGDAVISMWVQILCLAGQINDNGMIYFSKDIPYTDEMLATEFDRPINQVRLALATFERFKMIEIIDNVLLVSNWEKYQSADKLERIREQNRIRQQKFKERQKQLPESNVTGNGKVTQGNATELELELDKEKDKDIGKKKPIRHKYGEYKNVLLSDEQFEKLKVEFPKDWETRIEKVSEYCESSGKSYKNYLATIRTWARKDKFKNAQSQNGRAGILPYESPLGERHTYD